ncbi:hypothetical protein ACFL17_10330 [Pseudomonadota bacterium]
MSYSASSNNHLTIENWKDNEAIAEVREIYNEIQSKIKTNNFMQHHKNYDVKSKSCATYPIKHKSIAVDKAGFVRKLRIIQLISHRKPLLIERYYDVNGVIRFILKKSAHIEDRIFLDEKRNVILSVENHNGNVSITAYTNKDWETKPPTSSEAMKLYNDSYGCPSKK